MSEQKNAHHTAATVERAEREDAGSVSLWENFITSELGCQSGSISACLGIGAEHATPGHDLVQVLGLKDLRALTQLIERERRAGVPIFASVSGSQRGYYLAADPLELSRYVRSLDRRLHAVGETRRHLSDVLDTMTGQLRLEV